MKKILFVTVMILVTNLAIGADLNSFYKKADVFFKKYVDNGLVEYKIIKNNFSEIESLYKDIGNMDLSSASDLEKKSFYINAYNLIVIYQASKYYPLKSPLNQSGFFDKVKYTVAGESITLNYLEVKKLILVYNDPRMHFTLACGAISCPPLASFAYLPVTIESELTKRTKLALNDKNWLKIDVSQKKVLLSKIFVWYQKDFTMNGTITIRDFVNKYRDTPIPVNYDIDYYEYDWSLNEG